MRGKIKKKIKIKKIKQSAIKLEENLGADTLAEVAAAIADLIVSSS